MVAVASQPPIRTPSGGTTDQVFQPLADCGNGNPFFYHAFSDDFDQSVNVTGNYTVTATGGSVALTAGDGGLALFTTGAVAGNFAEIQTPVADFTVVSQPKKFFWLARLQFAHASTDALIAGMVETNATPFTSIANGIWFSKAAGSTQLVLNVSKASVNVATNIPTAAYTLANATNIDLAFYITRLGDVLAYVDTQLVGFIPQSNIGTTNNPQNAGAVARVTAPPLPTVALAPTLAISNGATAAATTMTADFHTAQKER